MFFHIYLERNMQLHPRHFGPHLRDKLIAKLIQDVEGTCRYVVCISLLPEIWELGLFRVLRLSELPLWMYFHSAPADGHQVRGQYRNSKNFSKTSSLWCMIGIKF